MLEIQMIVKKSSYHEIMHSIVKRKPNKDR